jgi:pyruvate,water dikinase
VLANYLRLSDQRPTPDIQFAHGAAAAEAAIDELVTQARRRGPIRAALVRLGLRRARQLIGYRESPKFLLVTALAQARQHIGEVGRALTASGVLSRADDVFFLDFGEAERALAGAGGDLRAVVAARRDDYERERRRRMLPPILLSDGTEPTPAGTPRERPRQPTSSSVRTPSSEPSRRSTHAATRRRSSCVTSWPRGTRSCTWIGSTSPNGRYRVVVVQARCR